MSSRSINTDNAPNMADTLIQKILDTENDPLNSFALHELHIDPKRCSRFELGCALQSLLEEDSSSQKNKSLSSTTHQILKPTNRLTFKQRISCLVVLRSVCAGLDGDLETFGDLLLSATDKDAPSSRKVANRDASAMVKSPLFACLVDQIIVQLQNPSGCDETEMDEEMTCLMSLFESLLPAFGQEKEQHLDASNMSNVVKSIARITSPLYSDNVGLLEGDPSASSPDLTEIRNDGMLLPGGFVEAMGGRVSELGQPEATYDQSRSKVFRRFS